MPQSETTLKSFKLRAAFITGDQFIQCGKKGVLVVVTKVYEQIKRWAASYCKDREKGQHEDEFVFSDPERRYGRPSMKEVELELLQRKESMTTECATRN